jgi:hypothetical protein
MTPQEFLVTVGTSLPISYLTKVGGYVEKATITLVQQFSIVAWTIGGTGFTHLSPSEQRRNTHTDMQINGRDL